MSFGQESVLVLGSNLTFLDLDYHIIRRRKIYITHSKIELC